MKPDLTRPSPFETAAKIIGHKRLARLKAAYKKACEDEAVKFRFDGLPLLTAFAKYLIEYMDMQEHGRRAAQAMKRGHAVQIKDVIPKVLRGIAAGEIEPRGGEEGVR